MRIYTPVDVFLFFAAAQSPFYYFFDVSMTLACLLFFWESIYASRCFSLLCSCPVPLLFFFLICTCLLFFWK